jgi:hypothetical protein
MKTQFIKSNISDLPQWAKGIIAIALLGGVAVVSYMVYKKIKKDKSNKNTDKVISQSQKEADDLIRSGMKLTHPKSTYLSVANYIQNMLDGCEIGSSELSVVKKVVFCVDNKLDWATLVIAFGTRKIDNCGFFTGDTMYELPALLSEQLDSTIPYDITNGRGYKDSGYNLKMSSVLKKYLNSKGISF